MIVTNIVNAHSIGNELLLFGYHRMNLETKKVRSKMDNSYVFGNIIYLKITPFGVLWYNERVFQINISQILHCLSKLS